MLPAAWVIWPAVVVMGPESPGTITCWELSRMPPPLEADALMLHL